MRSIAVDTAKDAGICKAMLGKNSNVQPTAKLDPLLLCDPEDFYSIDLMNAYKALGRIIGEEVDDDLVDEIFSKFCMGK